MSRKPKKSTFFKKSTVFEKSTVLSHSIRRHRVPTRKRGLGVLKGASPFYLFNAFHNAKRELVKKSPLRPVHRSIHKIEQKSGLQRLKRASPLTKVRVCVARYKRKAVLFATKKAGFGKAIRTPKHFSKDSNVSC